MLTMTLKNHLWRKFIPTLNFFSKNRKLVVRVMLCVFLLETILFLFFVKYVIVSDTGSYALAATALAATGGTNYTKPGLATEKLINDLKGAGLIPVLIQKIKRTQFSVEGELISLNGDNIQVFEYPDHETALKEGEIFAQKYITGTASNRWVNTMHLYIRDKIIVFYMGKEKGILVAFNNEKEFFLTKPSVAISRVSN